MLDEADITAMICEDMSILTKIQGILSSMGRKIGEDISIISVEHVKNAGAQMLPKIDCYYVPSLMLGETIATELLESMNHRTNNRVMTKSFMPEYLERGSVRKI